MTDFILLKGVGLIVIPKNFSNYDLKRFLIWKTTNFIYTTSD